MSKILELVNHKSCYSSGLIQKTIFLKAKMRCFVATCLVLTAV